MCAAAVLALPAAAAVAADAAVLGRVALLAAVGVLFHASKCEVGVRFTGRDNTLFDRALLYTTAFGYLFRVSEAEIHYLLPIVQS